MVLPWALCVSIIGCGDGVPANTTASERGTAAAGSFALEAPERMKRFHSKRFALSVPFPDGAGWRIDDHSQPELVATHAGTSSTLTVATWHDDQLVNRQLCEAGAEERRLAGKESLRVLEEATVAAPEMFDTRVVVGIEAQSSPSRPLVGHVFAFGGFLRKCLFFHYASEVPSAQDEATLSARLALARLRVFGGLMMDAFAEPPREGR
jgi:hypothetical protein